MQSPLGITSWLPVVIFPEAQTELLWTHSQSDPLEHLLEILN